MGRDNDNTSKEPNTRLSNFETEEICREVATAMADLKGARAEFESGLRRVDRSFERLAKVHEERCGPVPDDLKP